MSKLKEAQAIYTKKQIEFVLRRFKRLPVNAFIDKMSEWAVENRYLPPGVSEYYGPFEKTTAPHMIEPLDRLHPDDSITHLAIMKSVQSTATTSIAENGIGAWIKNKIGSILYLTSSKGIAKIRSSSAIDVMIDYSGLADCVKPISQRMKRKTADTSYYKEFAGGIKLLMSSYNSIGDLKSNTFHMIVRDEWDEAGAELKDQGDIAGIIEGRTMGLRHFKIIDISTPSRMETSRIYKSFKEGDQRYYYVPCPLCGEMQILELKSNDKEYGLTFTTEKNKMTGKKILIPETVRYICQFCQKDFGESKKQDMLLNGEWRPTGTPIDNKHTSYHVSGLYSPEMFLSWERICQQFINTEFGTDLLKFKDFTINYLGRAWASVKKQMAWEVFRDMALSYNLGEVPEGKLSKYGDDTIYDGPLILTAGVDIQKDRIECQVVGFGTGQRKWCIDYQIFYGDVGNIDDPCWIALHDFIYTKTYKICGKENYISKVAIDCGYDPKQDKREKDWISKGNLVYEFVSMRTDRCIAIMGFGENNFIGLLKESRVYNSNLTKRYNLNVSSIKEMIMTGINGVNKNIFFPRYKLENERRELLPDDFYKQMISERYQEIKPKVYGWKKIFKRNEVLDTFVYAIAAAEFQQLNSWNADRWIQYHKAIINS